MKNSKNIFVSLVLFVALSVVDTHVLSAMITPNVTTENALEAVQCISMHFQHGDDHGVIKGKYGKVLRECALVVKTALKNNMPVDPSILKKLTTIYKHIFADQNKKNNLIKRKNNKNNNNRLNDVLEVMGKDNASLEDLIIPGVDLGVVAEERHEEAPMINSFVQESGIPSLSPSQKAYRKRIREERLRTVETSVEDNPNDFFDDSHSSDKSGNNSENNEEQSQKSVFQIIIELDVILKETIQSISSALKKYANKSDKQKIKERLHDIRLNELNEMLSVLETVKKIVIKEEITREEKDTQHRILENLLVRYGFNGEIKKIHVCSGRGMLINAFKSWFQKPLNDEEVKELKEFDVQATQVINSSLQFFANIVELLDTMNS